MAVFYIGTYDIVDPEEFKKYPPLVMALLPKYGGVVLASDTEAFVVEGSGHRCRNCGAPNIAQASSIRSRSIAATK